MTGACVSKCFDGTPILLKRNYVLFVCRGYTFFDVDLLDISDDYFEITCVVIHICYNL